MSTSNPLTTSPHSDGFHPDLPYPTRPKRSDSAQLYYSGRRELLEADFRLHEFSEEPAFIPASLSEHLLERTYLEDVVRPLVRALVKARMAHANNGEGGVETSCGYVDLEKLRRELEQSTLLLSVSSFIAVDYTGSGGLIDYDGQKFGGRNDIVLITLNYRLGALGFLATDYLLNGNQTIHDQLMALQRVRDHIAAFSGDPNQITIFGQSAGAQSVMALLSSSAASGKFSAAIAQSSPIDLPWFSRDLYRTVITPNMATAVGCATETEAAMVACLRQVPYTSLIANTTVQQVATAVSGAFIGPGYFKGGIGLGFTEYCLPIVGGGDGVIDGQFVDLLSRGTLPNMVPTLFTEVCDEAFLFVDKVAPPLGSSQLTLGLVQLGDYSSLEATAMIVSGQFRVNSSDSDDVRNEFAAMLTQNEFLCPHGYLLDSYAKVFPQVWHAVLDKGHPLSANSDFSPAICDDERACHTADLLPIFGTLNVKTKDAVPFYSSDEPLYFQILNDNWPSFFRTHNPTPSKSYLRMRGPTFSATLKLFYGQSASLPFQLYDTYNDTNILGSDTLLHRPSRWQPQCQSFFDKYGYTFQRV